MFFYEHIEYIFIYKKLTIKESVSNQPFRTLASTGGVFRSFTLIKQKNISPIFSTLWLRRQNEETFTGATCLDIKKTVQSFVSKPSHVVKSFTQGL